MNQEPWQKTRQMAAEAAKKDLQYRNDLLNLLKSIDQKLDLIVQQNNKND